MKNNRGIDFENLKKGDKVTFEYDRLFGVDYSPPLIITGYVSSSITCWNTRPKTSYDYGVVVTGIKFKNEEIASKIKFTEPTMISLDYIIKIN